MDKQLHFTSDDCETVIPEVFTLKIRDKVKRRKRQMVVANKNNLRQCVSEVWWGGEHQPLALKVGVGIPFWSNLKPRSLIRYMPPSSPYQGGGGGGVSRTYRTDSNGDNEERTTGDAQ